MSRAAYTCRVTASNQAGSSSQTSAAQVVNPPLNEFTAGKVKLDKEKGTATIAVEVPAQGR